jgi:hypothetical protein
MTRGSKNAYGKNRARSQRLSQRSTKLRIRLRDVKDHGSKNDFVKRLDGVLLCRRFAFSDVKWRDRDANLSLSSDKKKDRDQVQLSAPENEQG